jgi:hypothetical protein
MVAAAVFLQAYLDRSRNMGVAAEADTDGDAAVERS